MRDAEKKREELGKKNWGWKKREWRGGEGRMKKRKKRELVMKDGVGRKKERKKRGGMDGCNRRRGRKGMKII